HGPEAGCNASPTGSQRLGQRKNLGADDIYIGQTCGYANGGALDQAPNIRGALECSREERSIGLSGAASWPAQRSPAPSPKAPRRRTRFHMSIAKISTTG